MIKIATVCTGIGSPEVAFEELCNEHGLEHEIVFACEIDKYPRASYLTRFKPKRMLSDMTAESWQGSEYYSDLFIGGIPCQSFSLAGKRLGELDKRGLLFYDFYRYVDVQRPKVFIIENVKGLLSDNSGKTFQNWLLLLGDSVNGHHQMFNHPDSLGYNLHWTVLNSKDFGVPQNRERVFIVGIRNDLPNSFRFPAATRLTVRLKDILEPVVDEKFYLSDKMLNYLNTRKDNFNNGKINYKTGNDVASCINASSKSIDISDNIIVEPGNPVVIVNNNGVAEERDIATCLDANYHKGVVIHAQRSLILSNEHSERVSGYRENENTISGFRDDAKKSGVQEEVYHKPEGILNTLTTNHIPKLIEPAEIDNSDINSDQTTIKQGDIYENKADAGRVYSTDGLARTLKASAGGMGAKTGLSLVEEEHPVLNEHRGHKDKDPKIITDGIVPTLRAESHGHETKVVVKEATKQGFAIAEEGDSINLSNPNSETRRGRVGVGDANTLDTACNQAVVEPNYRIRRLTPLECWRLQGLPDNYFYSAKEEAVINAVLSLFNAANQKGKLKQAVKGMSDTQLYKQAGNSISMPVIKAILKNILPILLYAKT